MLSALHSEVERIYNHLAMSDIKALAFCSANPNEGLSTVCGLLAQRSLLAGQRTLVVDFNSYHPSLTAVLDDIYPITANEGDSLAQSLACHPQLVCIEQKTSLAQKTILGVTAPQSKLTLLKLRTPSVLQAMVDEWKSLFDVIIFDTTPINKANQNNLPGELIAQACDACILLVKSGYTTEEQINEAMQKLTQHKVNLIGSILNDQDNPPLQQELLRELTKLGMIPSKLQAYLRTKILNSNFLNLDY